MVKSANSPVPPHRGRSRRRQIGIMIFCALIVVVPVAAVTLLRDAGAWIQSVLLPVCILIAIVIFFATSRDALDEHVRRGPD